MTIERTRELLGAKVAHLSDQEVLDFIQRTDQILNVLIKRSVVETNTIKQKSKKIK